MLLWLETGGTLQASAPFRIEPNVEHRLHFRATGGHVRLALNGSTIFENSSLRFVPNDDPVLVGSWVVPGREISWTLNEISAVKLAIAE